MTKRAWSGVVPVILIAAIAVALLGGTAGCGSDAAETSAQSQQGDATAEDQAAQGGAMTDQGVQLYTPEYSPNGSETAMIDTSKGRIVVELYGEDAPIHVGNFVELVRKGFYDGTKFHRYVEGFVIQGGDPQTKDASSQEVAGADGDPASRFGMGNPGYQIKGEFDPAVNPNKHVEGALGMARSQSPDSAGSQFYFALAPLPQLDGGYTVFGRVTEGLDVVKSLRAGDVIEKVVIDGATE